MRYRKLSKQAIGLLNILRREGDECSNLNRIAVRVAGQQYSAAYNRLRCLAVRGLVTVVHHGKAIPIHITVNRQQMALEEA